MNGEEQNGSRQLDGGDDGDAGVDDGASADSVAADDGDAGGWLDADSTNSDREGFYGEGKAQWGSPDNWGADSSNVEVG